MDNLKQLWHDDLVIIENQTNSLYHDAKRNGNEKIAMFWNDFFVAVSDELDRRYAQEQEG